MIVPVNIFLLSKNCNDFYYILNLFFKWMFIKDYTQ